MIESVDVAQAVDAALKNLRAGIDESGATIVRDPLPTIEANELELIQVFQNLIGNAIKFKRKGVAPKVHIGAERMPGVKSGRVRGQGSGVRSQGTGSRKSEAGPADMAETGVAWQPVAARPPLPDTRNLIPDTWLFSVRDNGIGIEPRVRRENLRDLSTSAYEGGVSRHGSWTRNLQEDCGALRRTNLG